METQDFSFRVKSAADEGGTGKFSGFASVYGNEDLMNDVIVPGAWKNAVAGQPQHGYPLLLGHKQDTVLGGVRVRETTDGLHTEGEIDLTDEVGRSTFSKVQKHWLRGLSVGFSVEPGGSELDSKGRRLLKNLRLFEVSLVAIPANPLAQVTGTKALQTWLKALQGRESLDPGLLAEIAEIEAGLMALKSKHSGSPDLKPATLERLQRLARPEAWA